jgi:chromatin remodeling complex protein RSC6
LRKELIEGGHPKLSIEEANELQKKKKAKIAEVWRKDPRNKESIQRSDKKDIARRSEKDSKFVF